MLPPEEATLEAAIVRAELEGRRTVADALARRLDSLRGARAVRTVGSDDDDRAKRGSPT